MKTVFEPSNALEGHMLQDLLTQRGISSRLDGAGLQGAVGELPAIGLVRLVVEDDDFRAARAVIDDWEKAAAPDPVSPPRKPRTGALSAAAVGLALGVAGTAMYYRMPAHVDGIDHNGDGILDERWISSASGSPVRTEMDRNFDGKIDFMWHLDRNGLAESGASDDDFNGTFETRYRLRNGQVYLSEADTNGDSDPDLTSLATFGVLTTVEHKGGDSDRPVRVETFRLGRLVSADVDTDRDGVLDRRYLYDAYGEVDSVDEIR